MWPVYSEDEIAAATEVLRSGRVNYWTGRHGREFECEFAEFCGVKHAVALANGTVALELALRAVGIERGDEVVVTARSFFASASSIVACGAQPVFADVDADSQNITPATIEKVLTPKSRAIIAVHLAGWPCDMPEILALSARRGLRVIEDCAQAHGASIQNKRVGSFGDVAAFSFCTDKIISTGGEGGMLVTNNDAIWECAWSLKDHGKSVSEIRRTDHPIGFRWLHDRFGTNGRMTEFQAAIGRRQLKKLDSWLESRAANANVLIQELGTVQGLRVPRPTGGVRHAWYKFYCFVVAEALRSGWNRDRILTELAEQGVSCFSGSCPEIYRERAFESTDWRPAHRLEVARRLGETSLMFAVDPEEPVEKLRHSADALRRILARAIRS